MRNWSLMMALLLISSWSVVRADEKITVEATSTDISEGLDLKAVASLFGEVKNLEEFETRLNADTSHLNNLDLNGDGEVDYLRVVEVEQNSNHMVLIQAVLAKDVFQDIASILVEKSGTEVTVQIKGDAYIYGENYIIEPVYIYRPVIYDWFWGPYWVCYTSPWYWGYWPGWWRPYPCWGYHDYWVHIHVWHHGHPCCSYRYARTEHSIAAPMRGQQSRSDYARISGNRSFTERTGATNARDLSARSRTAQVTSTATPSRSATTVSRSASTSTSSSSSTSTSRSTSRSTYGSSYTRSGSASATTSRSASTSTSTSSSTSTSTSSSSSSSVSRSTTYTPSR
ncbi:MAG: hypothetical protein MJZ59_05245, partial [Paludibacteraceae bacterium]|nr:hypothetical protein [Paludibacteraceae bacterium]